MLKIAIILLAGQDTPEGAGRMANALTTTQEFQEAAGDDVRLMFDGARPDHPSLRVLVADGFQVITF